MGLIFTKETINQTSMSKDKTAGQSKMSTKELQDSMVKAYYDRCIKRMMDPAAKTITAYGIGYKDAINEVLEIMKEELNK